MSIEHATAFKQLVTDDAGLKAEVLTAHQTGGLSAVCALAAGRGYSFGPADATAALTPAEGELSDLELEAIAGGKKVNKASSFLTTQVDLNAVKNGLVTAKNGIVGAYNTTAKWVVS